MLFLNVLRQEKEQTLLLVFLHHYLSHNTMGEQELNMHADHCVGQNRSNVAMHYLWWRVIVGLN